MQLHFLSALLAQHTPRAAVAVKRLGLPHQPNPNCAVLFGRMKHLQCRIPQVRTNQELWPRRRRACHVLSPSNHRPAPIPAGRDIHIQETDPH